MCTACEAKCFADIQTLLFRRDREAEYLKYLRCKVDMPDFGQNCLVDLVYVCVGVCTEPQHCVCSGYCEYNCCYNVVVVVTGSFGYCTTSRIVHKLLHLRCITISTFTC